MACRPICRHFIRKTSFAIIYRYLQLKDKNAYNCR